MALSIVKPESLKEWLLDKPVRNEAAEELTKFVTPELISAAKQNHTACGYPFLIGYAPAEGGLHEAFCLDPDPVNLASFIVKMGKERGDLMICTPLDTPFLNTFGTFIDRCADQDFLQKHLLPVLVPMQIPKQKPLGADTPLKKGGVVVGMRKEGDKEKIYFVGDDCHLLCVGATRSGKSRCLVLESICLLGLAGESIFCSDPKAELFHYTADFLKKLGYEVLVLDFKNPEKSMRYNLLQPIIDAISEGDTDRAEMLAWDLTNNLVGKPEGEKIWTNGECSIIAAAILCVVCDNQKRPEFQNMTNVYWFISEMCRTIGNKMPLLEYVKKLSPSHPARALLSISDVAPSRTRGSFYTSALTTLRLFTSKSIYAITHTSDFTLADMGSKKQALFVILPDEKTTFYPIASLIVSQQYELLAEAADRRGGRLERRVNFILDEYGNFTPISDMTNKLTVAAGRGMRYALFVQGFDQLKEKYSDNIANTIKGNCQVWAYLQSDDPETLREMSDKLGSYTTSSYQLSASNGKYTTPSNSQSVSLTERKLLNTDEVRRVKRPHQIITSRDHPAMMYAPDLSQWMFNKMLGLGDMEHNRRLREEREQKRPIITDTKQEIALWNIWIYYQKDIMRRLSQQKGAMGGGLDDD